MNEERIYIMDSGGFFFSEFNFHIIFNFRGGEMNCSDSC